MHVLRPLIALAALALITSCLTASASAADAPAKPDPSDLGFVWSRMSRNVPPGYVAPRAAGPVTLDGKADEPAWANAAWAGDFADIEGDLRPKPRFRTRAKMMWDDENLYVHALLEEPHVWATITQRNAVMFADNDFELFIDPDGDNLNYYEFEMNALNMPWQLSL